MGNKLKNSNEEVTQNINTETNSRTNSIQIIKTNNKWQERIEEYEGIILDSPDGRLIKTILKIEFTKKKKIKYSSSDGSIYRMLDQVKDFSKDQEIMLNTEQIKYLQWVGNYDKNQKKYGKWVAIWQGHTLSNIGGFYMKNGEKEGFWMELFEQFQNKARVFQHGEYDNENRILEIYLQKQRDLKRYYEQLKISGCGSYGKQSKKFGKWIELSKNFQKNNQYIYNGEYKNGKKFDIWDVKVRFYGTNRHIGGGLYNKTGKKVGLWIELIENLKDSNIVTQQGFYIDGKKIDRWNVYFMKNDQWENFLIGNGLYGDLEQKIGKWTELGQNLYKNSYITYQGEYLNGKKVDRWVTYWYEVQNNKNQQIGGGVYDQQNQKIGKWIELSQNFYQDSQITYKGIYENGKKLGKWVTQWKINRDTENTVTGGGEYNQLSQKIGIWFEFSDNFYKESQIIYQGEYNNGQKIGKWETLWKDYGDSKFAVMYNYIKQLKFFINSGGGEYNQLSQKIGKWIELSDNFFKESIITYLGNYKNGKKIGRWDIFYKKNYGDYQSVNIGGGSYDDEAESERKIGKWVELTNGFYWENQILYCGEYKKGKKFGKWEEIKKDFVKIKEGFKKIREYYYDY